ncbi:autotransporter-associated beta strand repeat-containing protein [Lysobacter sp. GCM10012299]|uniref:autotransporter-associated beta strand repeat-containing protein n=1 Tax=Lysobacter sp. GCM10012299 TaxID=3317333 RepID=UPI003622A603
MTMLGPAAGSGGTTGSIAGNVTDNGTLTFNRSDAVTYAGLVTGTGALIQLGGGTLTLTGNNSYTGGTAIGAAGTLQLGDGGTTGSIVGNVTDNGTLVFNRSDVVTYAGVVAGTGSVIQAGSGTTILTGNNTYLGGSNPPGTPRSRVLATGCKLPGTPAMQASRSAS